MKKLLAGLLAAMMLVSIIACAGDDPGVATGGVSELGFDYSDLPVFDIAGTTVTVASWGDGSEEAIASFEEWSGATLNWLYFDDDEYEQLIMAAVMAGTPPDAVEFYDARGVRLMNGNLLQPLDELVDFNHEHWGFIHDVELGVREGQRYLAVMNRQSWFQMFYNYSMFEAEGLETPTVLLDRGEWTWGRLLDLARHFTRDTTGDGMNDMIGVATDWTGYVPMMMAVTYDVAFIIEDDAGVFHNNVNDPRLATVFDYYHTMLSEGLLDPDLQTFLSGAAPMFLGGAWYVWDEVKSAMLIGREIAMVPSPTPCGTIEGQRFGTSEGFAITRNAANPEGAAAFITWWLWFTQIQGQDEIDEEHWAITTGFTEREFRYFGELNYAPHADQFFDGNPIWDAYSAIENGEEWSSVREWIFPQTQLIVDDLNRGG